MKPKIGRKVYCIYYDGIIVDTVGWIGKDSFIIDSINSGGTEDDSWEWNYEDYNVHWFTSLAKAKKALIERYQNICEDKLKVTQITEDWYQLEFC